MEKYNFDFIYLFIKLENVCRKCMNEIEKLRAVNAEKGESILDYRDLETKQSTVRPFEMNGSEAYNKWYNSDEKWLQDIIFYQLYPNEKWIGAQHTFESIPHTMHNPLHSPTHIWSAIKSVRLKSAN